MGAVIAVLDDMTLVLLILVVALAVLLPFLLGAIRLQARRQQAILRDQHQVVLDRQTAQFAQAQHLRQAILEALVAQTQVLSDIRDQLRRGQ